MFVVDALQRKDAFQRRKTEHSKEGGENGKGYSKEGRKGISRKEGRIFQGGEGGGKEGRLFQGGKKGHFKEKRKNTQRKEGRRCIYISRARARK